MRAIFTGQLRGEAEAAGLNTQLVVWSAASELAGLGLAPIRRS